MECNRVRASPQVQRLRVVANDVGMRLDNYLLRLLSGVPRSHVYRIIRNGEVRVNGRRPRAHTRLCADDEVRVPPVRMASPSAVSRPPDKLVARAQTAVVAQSEDWVLVNKPAGLAVHAGSGLRFGLIELLRYGRAEPALELVHRLDRATSGCLMLARNRASLTRLRAAWRGRKVEKEYLALLCGRWAGGPRTVDAPLLRDRLHGGERMAEVAQNGKYAHSLFTPREVFRCASLVQVTITTGRTHQIRVHATHSGHPVAGDSKYGPRSLTPRLRRAGLTRMFLHARRLRLPETGEQWEAPLALELENVLAWLRQNDAP